MAVTFDQYLGVSCPHTTGLCQTTLDVLAEIDSRGVNQIIEAQDRNAQAIRHDLGTHAAQAHSDSNSLWWELAGIIEELGAQTIAIDGAIVALGADLDLALTAMTADLDGFITASTALTTTAIAASTTAVVAELESFKRLISSKMDDQRVLTDRIVYNTGITNSRLSTVVLRQEQTNALLLRILECFGCA